MNRPARAGRVRLLLKVAVVGHQRTPRDPSPLEALVRRVTVRVVGDDPALTLGHLDLRLRLPRRGGLDLGRLTSRQVAIVVDRLCHVGLFSLRLVR